VLALATGLPACGALLGIEAGVPEEAGTDGGSVSPGPDAHAGRDGSVTATKDGRADTTRPDSTSGGGEAGDAASESMPGSPSTDAGIPMMADGGPPFIYVQAGAPGAVPCGKEMPCGSIQLGLMAAQAAVASGGATWVLVTQGVYEEIGTLALGAGVSIQGGFSPSWTQSTPGGLDAGTVVIVPQSTAMSGQNVAGSISLVNFTLMATGDPGPGGSTFGLMLTSDGGVDGSVSLKNVLIVAGDGGDGLPGADGGGGAPAPMTCASGASGQAGSPGKPPAQAGSFGIGGFTPSSGGGGDQGQPGELGQAGAQSCVAQYVGCPAHVGCVPFGTEQACVDGGAGGCGGGGGLGGAGGGGGGSSVALFVWGVPVTVSGGAFVAGNGGNGGAGGYGGAGAPGGPASTPPTASLGTGCNSLMCVYTNVDGGTGKVGEQGGAGGNGAAGAGGSSYSIFWGGLFEPDVTGDPRYVQGAPGKGSTPGVARPVGSGQ
jgi:hypothetical protein